MLLLTSCFESRAAVDLKVDINDRVVADAGNTEGGFQAFLIDSAGGTGAQSGSITRMFGAQSVTMGSSIPGTLTYDDRRRTEAQLTNQGDFTQKALLQDFVFAIYNANTPDGGIDVEIAGLDPGKEYAVRLWSFDPVSGGNRVSDWMGNGVLKVDNYTFSGGLAPATNEQYQLNFTVVADAGGKILLEGRRDPASADANNAASHGVFLNALWVRDLVVDEDEDDMPDAWETLHGLNPLVKDGDLDPDMDNLKNLDEYLADTDPQDSDTDNDTLLDGYENKSGTWVSVSNTGTNPLLVDTDGDGLADNVENPGLPWTGPTQPGTNPNLADTDNDTFPDGLEVSWPTNPQESAEFPNPAVGSTLALDFESATAVPQPGFTAMGPESGWMAAFGALNVTITPTGACTLDHRDRAAAGGGGSFNPLYRDFLFGNANGGMDPADGLDVSITGLAPLTTYPITLWGWDPSSAATARHSQWLASEGVAGPVIKVPAYTMANVLPDDISDHRIRFDATTSAEGVLVIQGRRHPDLATTATHSVFLNGLIVGPAVTPLKFTSFGPLAGGSFPLTWTSDAITNYKVEASPDLTAWQTIAPSVSGQAGTTTFTETAIPASATKRYYRVSRANP